MVWILLYKVSLILEFEGPSKRRRRQDVKYSSMGRSKRWIQRTSQMSKTIQKLSSSITKYLYHQGLLFGQFEYFELLDRLSSEGHIKYCNLGKSKLRVREHYLLLLKLSLEILCFFHRPYKALGSVKPIYLILLIVFERVPYLYCVNLVT